jgi:putative ABC transport system substrate-binding protein
MQLALPPRAARIGYLVAGTLDSTQSSLAAFREGLSALGYVEGRNITLEVRTADGYEDRLPELAAALVRVPVDVLVTSGTAAIHAAVQTTDVVPIVFANAADPVADGFVVSLSSPGGRATGLTMAAGDESGKRMDLLKQAIPGVSRVAIVWTQTVNRYFAQTAAAAQALGVDIVSLEVNSPEELNGALDQAVASGADGLNVLSSASLVPLAKPIVEFAANARLPAIYGTTIFATAGGLLTYSPNTDDNFRSAATFVDKILKGARPADLPIERPTRYEFVVNLKAAQLLGIAISEEVIQQATQVIR